MIKYWLPVYFVMVIGAMVLFNGQVCAQVSPPTPATPFSPMMDAAAPAMNPAMNMEPHKPETKEAPPANNEPEIKSLLFSDTDIATIHSARLFYEQHSNGVVDSSIAEDDFLKNLEKITILKSYSDPKSFTYPQFFLSSIAYYSPDNWVVWVNDEKITQDSGVSAAGLRVMEIDKEKVVFDWKPARMDKILDNDYSPDNPVKVDFIENKVSFVLKANQTFTSYAMQVVEGKILPVTINTDTDISAKILGK